MTFQFVEVNPEEVELGRRDLDENNNYVYDHLKYYCSKNDTIPAFEVKEVNGRLTSVDRHMYLKIAKELKRKSTRAVIINDNFEALRSRGVRGLVSIIPNDVLEREVQSLENAGWHVFFFQSRPSPELAEKICDNFRQFLHDSLSSETDGDIDVEFDIEKACLSIKFSTPISDRDWLRSFRVFCRMVNADLLPIATYQGMRWNY